MKIILVKLFNQRHLFIFASFIFSLISLQTSAAEVATVPKALDIPISSKVVEVASDSVSLHIAIKGIDSKRKGILIVTLYQGKESWMKREKVLQYKKFEIIDQKNIRTQFEGLSPNQEYAVIVLQDENDNKEMDIQLFPPKAKEGYAVSNNNVRLGSPKYKAAVFNSAEHKSISLEMRY